MRTGSKIAVLAIALTGVAGLFAGPSLFAGHAIVAAQRNNGPHAVVAGSVFREDGFSLRGATVTLVAKPAATPSAKDAGQQKPMRSHSDARGEFAFRVPPGPGAYLVKAAMKGFQTVEKETSVAKEERVDVTLVLPSESK